ALACIAIQANQNEMHGGQSVPNFDFAMADGVRKTYKKKYRHIMKQYLQIRYGMTEEAAQEAAIAFEKQLSVPIAMGNVEQISKEIPEIEIIGITAEQLEEIHQYTQKEALRMADRETYQAMEGLVHNLNTMNSRAGAQVPFSSINYGTDTSPEARMVIRNLLSATEEGLGNGETPIFPVQIFKVKEGINYNPGDPNYDLFQLAIATSAKRLFPNFSFIDAPFNLAYYKEGDPNTEVAYMGCRTRVLGNVHDPERQTTY